MKGRSLRLSSLSSPSIASPNSASQYVCLHCRHRASSIRQTAVSPTLSSIPFNRRSYATEPSIPDKFQAYFNKTIGKRLFKDGKIPGTVDETDQPDDKPAGPPGVEKTTTDLLDDDPDYKPATSGEGLEAVGGPTGWWEKTWDEEHQFQGWMRPTPMTDPVEIQRAVERAMVEWYTVEKGSIEFQESVGAAKSLWANNRSWELPGMGSFKLWQNKKGEVQLHWERPEDQVEMERWLAKPFQNKTEPTELEDGTSAETEPTDVEATTSTSAVEADSPEVIEGVPKDVTDIESNEPDEVLLAEGGEAQDSPETQEDLTEEPPHIRYHGPQLPLSDMKLKFTIIKRVMQLTGIRIPDTAIQSINSTLHLWQHLIQPPKPKKLAEILMEGYDHTGRHPISKVPLLAHLPNVQVLATKHTPSMTETALGRQKVIDQQLDEHGIAVPFKEEMEQITAFEEERLRRRIDAMGEDAVGEGRDMWSQAPLDDVSGRSKEVRS